MSMFQHINFKRAKVIMNSIGDNNSELPTTGDQDSDISPDAGKSQIEGSDEPNQVTLPQVKSDTNKEVEKQNTELENFLKNNEPTKVKKGFGSETEKIFKINDDNKGFFKKDIRFTAFGKYKLVKGKVVLFNRYNCNFTDGKGNNVVAPVGLAANMEEKVTLTIIGDRDINNIPNRDASYDNSDLTELRLQHTDEANLSESKKPFYRNGKIISTTLRFMLSKTKTNAIPLILECIKKDELSYITRKIGITLLQHCIAQTYEGVTLKSKKFANDTVFEFVQLSTNSEQMVDQIKNYSQRNDVAYLIGNNKFKKLDFLHWMCRSMPVYAELDGKVMNGLAREHSNRPTKITVYTDQAQLLQKHYNETPDDFWCDYSNVEKLLEVMTDFVPNKDFNKVIQDSLTQSFLENFISGDKSDSEKISTPIFKVPNLFGIVKIYNSSEKEVIDYTISSNVVKIITSMHKSIDIISTFKLLILKDIQEVMIDGNMLKKMYVKDSLQGIMNAYQSSIFGDIFVKALYVNHGISYNLPFKTIMKKVFDKMVSDIVLNKDEDSGIHYYEFKTPTFIFPMVSQGDLFIQNSLSQMLSGNGITSIKHDNSGPFWKERYSREVVMNLMKSKLTERSLEIEFLEWNLSPSIINISRMQRLEGFEDAVGTDVSIELVYAQTFFKTPDGERSGYTPNSKKGKGGGKSGPSGNKPKGNGDGGEKVTKKWKFMSDTEFKEKMVYESGGSNEIKDYDDFDEYESPVFEALDKKEILERIEICLIYGISYKNLLLDLYFECRKQWNLDVSKPDEYFTGITEELKKQMELCNELVTYSRWEKETIPIETIVENREFMVESIKKDIEEGIYPITSIKKVDGFVRRFIIGDLNCKDVKYLFDNGYDFDNVEMNFRIMLCIQSIEDVNLRKETMESFIAFVKSKMNPISYEYLEVLFSMA